MTKKMYCVGSDWGMHMELYVYKSREDVWKDLERVHNSIGVGCSYESCVESGFYSVKELEVVEFDNE